jgi:hypothetical protein
MKKILTFTFILLITLEGIFSTNYYQGKLSKNEIALYNTISTSLLNEINVIDIDPSYTKDEVNQVNEAMFKDLPQLFFVNQSYNYAWSQTSSGKIVSAKLTYTFKDYPDDISTTREIVKNKILDFVDTLDTLSTDAQKIEVIYRYFALTRNYDASLVDDQSCYSVLINKRGVCASYARSFQYIMIYLNIPNIYVSGTLYGVSHAWNMVEIDNKWYHVDVTNGNTGFDDYCTYQYLLIPTSKMEQSVLIENKALLPLAYSDDYNYYKNNNLYITAFNENKLDSRIKEAVSNKSNGITFEFKTDQLLSKAKVYLIDEQNIFDLIGKNNIIYNIEEGRKLLTIHF